MADPFSHQHKWRVPCTLLRLFVQGASPRGHPSRVEPTLSNQIVFVGLRSINLQGKNLLRQTPRALCQ